MFGVGYRNFGMDTARDAQGTGEEMGLFCKLSSLELILPTGPGGILAGLPTAASQSPAAGGGCFSVAQGLSCQL